MQGRGIGMSDYSWIKPGVKAILVDCRYQFESCNGQIIEVREIIENGTAVRAVEEDLLLSMGGVYGIGNTLIIKFFNLKPLKDDDIEYPNWEEISNPINLSQETINELEHV